MQNNQLLEYTKESAQELKKLLKRSGVNKKAVGDGEFKVIASTDGIDRDGEIIQISAWDFENFYKNPVLLWGHNYYELPIGAVTNLSVEGNQLIATGVFATSDFAQEVRKLYDDGILKAVSVGFIVREREGQIITKAELLELSFVTVPSNPNALSIVKGLEEKYLKLEVTLESGGEDEEQMDLPNPAAHHTAEHINETQNGQDPTDLLAEYPRSKNQDVALIEAKEGRVLSSKNRDLVQNAIDALTALLNASDTPPKNIRENLLEAKRLAQDTDKIVERLIVLLKGTEQKL